MKPDRLVPRRAAGLLGMSLLERPAGRMLLALSAAAIVGCTPTTGPDSIRSEMQVGESARWQSILSHSAYPGLSVPSSASPGGITGAGWASAAVGGPADPERSAVLVWNDLARDLVATFRENPPRAARGYALLSVAQYDALVALRGFEERGQRGATPRPVSPGSLTGSGAERAVLAGASFEVLSALFPSAIDRLEERAFAELAAAAGGGAARHQPEPAFTLGREVGRRVLDYAADDGWNAVWSGTIPTGPGFWFSSATPPAPPLLPLWGSVRPWLMASGDQFTPPPPPAFGSPAFEEALAEVRWISDNRTEEQLRIALFWADDPGTATPPGHWNQIAADLIARHRMPAQRAAWVMALLNMAMMDASISCWHTKYVYWLIRPSQADPQITMPVPLPNFPAYTSGHSTFSGAAGEFLGSAFPSERQRLWAMAEEAAISRVYGGIHYRFDSDEALVIGRRIGRLAVERGRELRPDGL